MKKTYSLTVLVLSLFCFASSQSFGISRDALRDRLRYPGSASYAETQRIARQNLNLVEEILFISDSGGFNGNARFHGLIILKHAAEDGLISPEKFFSVLLRLEVQKTSIAHPGWQQDLQNMIIGNTSSFGLDKNYPIAKQFDAFIALSGSMLESGLISNHGVQNSLSKKISNAKDTVGKKKPNWKTTSVNQMNAVINELNAQKGKAITEEGYQILTRYCQNLITKIQNTN